jgi:hypothetical protein
LYHNAVIATNAGETADSVRPRKIL